MKANDHPLVRDIRRLLDKHKLDGAILIAIQSDGYPISVSAGADVAKCNALGDVLQSDHVDHLFNEMDEKLMGVKGKT